MCLYLSQGRALFLSGRPELTIHLPVGAATRHTGRTTATGAIEGGNIATDCSFTYGGGLTLSLGCTGRPATQVWYLDVYCGQTSHGLPSFTPGNEVTGEGTSTATCPKVITEGLLETTS